VSAGVAAGGGDDVADLVGDLVGAGDYVVDAAGEVHHAEGVLEALVGGAGVDQVGERELVDVAQPLEGGGVDHRLLVVVVVDEDVDRVADLVDALGQPDQPPPGSLADRERSRFVTNVCSHSWRMPQRPVDRGKVARIAPMTTHAADRRHGRTGDVRRLVDDPLTVEKVDGDTPEALRLHPEPGSPHFIPRLGFRQERLGPLLAKQGVTMTVSPLYYMAHNPELALFTARKPPLGLALDPATHLRQLPHSQRAPAFRALPFGRLPAAFDSDRSPISEVEYADLVTSPLDLARARGATLLLNAYHLSGAVGTRGRSLDLAIARDALAHFRAQRMEEPPEFAAVPVRRELYVVLALPCELLESSGERRRLAEAYLALEADGLWVKIAGFDERARRTLITAGGAFLALLARGGRPVVADGPGHLHLGLLANDISTSIGLAESERFLGPQPRTRDDWSGGRTRTIYHPKYLRSFRAGGDGAVRAFTGSGCPCRRHPAKQPPAGTAIDEHAAIVRAREAREALEGEVLERREWLLANAAMASHRAHDAGVDYTPPLVFEALLEGIDSIDRDELEETG